MSVRPAARVVRDCLSLVARLWRSSPTASVILITYNHERYIAQAIESVLMQEFGFDYELLISEDCSTDGTREILYEYQRRHPERIRLLLSPHNLANGEVLLRAARAARGRYVAVLEGDDYWTSPHKLRKQVDFLQHHPEYAICYHNVEVIHEDGSRPPYLFNPADQPATSSLEDVLVRNFMQTCSVVVRNRALGRIPAWYDSVVPKDWAMHILNAEHGKIGYLDEVMAVYRVHPGSLWSSRSRAGRLEATADFYEKVNAHLGFRCNELLAERISRCRFELSLERSGLPHDATVIVVGNACDALACAEGRRVWSFPQNPDGTYSDRQPASAEEAIVMLEALRVGGGQFLAVPARAFGWLEEQSGFRRHLEGWHRRFWSDEHCVVYELRDRPVLNVAEVSPARLDEERLWGFHIDLPQPGSLVDASEIPLAGWAVGRGSPVAAVEVLRDDVVIERASFGARRPDLPAAFPAAIGAVQGGFLATLSLPGLSSGPTLLVEAVLQDERRFPIGSVHVAGFAAAAEPSLACPGVSQAVAASPTSRRVLVGTVDVLRSGGSAEALWGYHLDRPTAGSQCDAVALDIAGWVLGRFAPAVAIEVVHHGVVVERVPVGASRPDVAAAHPSVAEAHRAGFHARIDVGSLLTVSLRARVILMDDSHVPVGAIRLEVQACN